MDGRGKVSMQTKKNEKKRARFRMAMLLYEQGQHKLRKYVVVG
jgi:hypothetical protein